MSSSVPSSPRVTTVVYWQKQFDHYVSDEASRKHMLGLFFIFLVAIIWISASFLVQALVSTKPGQDHAPMHPFVLTYVCNSLFLIYLVIAPWQNSVIRSRQAGAAHRSSSGCGVLDVVEQDLTAQYARTKPAATACYSREQDTADVRHATSLEVAGSTSNGGAPSSDDSEQVKLLTATAAAALAPDKWQLAKAALAVAPLWFVAQLCFNYSLLFTSVTSNTVLSSPASLFTFILSVLILGERFSFGKLLAVLLTIAGTITVASVDARLSASADGADGGAAAADGTAFTGVLGDMLALLAAVFYACYTVTLRVMMPDEAEGSMTTFFGYLGLINFVAFMPVLLLLELTHHVSFFSIGAVPLGLAFIKGLLDNALSDYLWARAILLVGPTIATVGLSIQVPIAMLVDPMFHTYGWWSELSLCLMEIFGALCILCGFLAVSMDFEAWC